MISCRKHFRLSRVFALALCVCLSVLVPALAHAQLATRQVQEISATDLSTGATRVLIVLDSPVADYDFSGASTTFHLRLPRTALPRQELKLAGAQLKTVDFATRDANLLITFQTQPNVTAKVQQQSKFVLVFFTPNANSNIRLIPPRVAPNSAPALSERPRLATRPPTAPATLPANNGIVMRPPVSPSSIPPITSAPALPLATAVSGKKLNIPKVGKAPTLDDFVLKRRREAEVIVSDFRQLQPGDGEPASQPTTAYLSYDDDTLYVVFVCRDDPEKIRSHVSRREDIDTDDAVSITLDTFHDLRRAYTFVVNPAGVQLDGILTEGQGTDYSFDTLWKSDARITAEGYIVRMAIPFKSLRFSGAELQTWGIALGRSIIRNNEQSYWPYITERVQGFVQQMATAEGLQKISSGRNIEVRPYAAFTAARTPNLDPATLQTYRNENEFRAGVDAKVVFRDALTLDLTVNPDFSQVESDEPQVIVNQRFEVFFPEKRPFFIENAGFFQTPDQLFFSRRIVEPQFGARLTGKVGRWAMGGLLIDDRAAGKLDPDGPRSSRALIGVARIQREFGEQSSLGLLVTNRNYRNSSNQVLAADGRLQLNPNWTLSAQAARSYTRDVGGRRRTGSAYLAQLTGSGRNFNYGLTYTDRSPNFRAELGYVPRVDVRQVEQYANYRWRPESRRVVSFGPAGYFLLNWDRQGRLQDWYADAGFGVQMKRQTFIDVDHAQAYEFFEGQGFRTHNTNVSFVSDPLEWFGFSASYGSGSTVNYSPADGLSPFEADSSGGNLTLTLRPTARVSFYQSYIYRRLATRNNEIAFAGDGTTIFNNHILRSKFNYQFTRKLSLRFILDYDAVQPNASLIALDHQKRLTPDILLTYLVNPGTALYVGYTDRYENLLLSPRSFTRVGSPTTPTDRQFFVKMSYLFRH